MDSSTHMQPIFVTSAPNPHGLLAPARLTPSLSPVMLPRTSPDFFAVPSMSSLKRHSEILAKYLGDYVAFADSKTPRKYVNDAGAPIKRIVYSDGAYQVLFSDLPGHCQIYQIRIDATGRVQLFSPKNPQYRFSLLPCMPQFATNCLSWANDFDPTHVVSWQRVPTNKSLKYEDFFRGASMTPRPLLARPSSSRRSSASSSCTMETYCNEDNIPLVLPSVAFFDDKTPKSTTGQGIFLFPSGDSLNLPIPHEPERSRPPSPRISPSPARICPSNSFSPVSSRRNSFSYDLPNDPLSLHKRDSKQSLVNRVEPEVDAMIGHLYAKKEEWRVNQSGRHGPPVLRGDDVLFIPAKKQAALESVEELIKLVQKTCTVRAASKVCQKKKKRQKKGFLVYLQLASAAEVQNFLNVYYPPFENTVAGVKTAIFAKDKALSVSH